MIILFRLLKVFFTIGQFLFQVFSLGFIWTFIAKKIYLKQLKNECGSIGLKHVPSEYYDEFGHLQGGIKNYKINVKFRNFYRTQYPGGSQPVGETVSDTLITLKSDAPKYIKGFELKREKPRTRPERGEEDFKTDNFNFNRIFKTRRGDPSAAKRFKEIPELPDKFAAFYLKWIFRLDDFYVEIDSDEQCFYCTLKYGRPWTQYISLANLREILNDLVALVEFFDTSMSGKKP